MNEEQHHIDVHGYYRGENNPVFRATCSCGWVGPDVPSKGAADNEGTDHVLAAIGH